MLDDSGKKVSKYTLVSEVPRINLCSNKGVGIVSARLTTLLDDAGSKRWVRALSNCAGFWCWILAFGSCGRYEC